ncbi:MAG: flagellin [Desulfotalea sp.]
MVNSLGSGFNAGNYINKAQNSSANSFNRLSSGNRINSAKDDAAGLAISDRMSSQVLGLNQAMRNANDGISLTQTADGALSESTNILQRMRELSVQSGNGIYNGADRASMNDEFSQLNSELSRISGTTAFNGKNLLDGSMSASFQVGANGGETIQTSLGDAGSEALGLADLNILTVGNSQMSIEGIDQALSSISEMRGEMGAVQNRFESTISNLGSVAENITASRSRIADADVAKEVSELTKSQILEKVGIAIQAQANQSAGLTLSLLKP